MQQLIDAIIYAIPYLMGGLGTTLLVSLITVALSLVAGVVLGVGLIYGPLPLRWVAEHVEYEPPHLFADVQRSGPFAYWYHRHRFEPTARGTTLMTDEVDYALPLGFLGEWVAGWFVRRKLQRMFDYRHSVVTRAFATG